MATGSTVVAESGGDAAGNGNGQQIAPEDPPKVTRDAINEPSPVLFEVPREFRSDMRVPARFYLSHEMLEGVISDGSLDQLVNVATLPGIERYALAMPDIHQGYGFPIGGVAAKLKPIGVVKG